MHFHIEAVQLLLRTMCLANMFNIFSKYGTSLHIFCFCRLFNKVGYNKLTFKSALMTTQYIKVRKCTTWSNHLFSHGAGSDWPVRGQASTYNLFIHQNPALSRHCGHNSSCENTKNIALLTALTFTICLRFDEMEPKDLTQSSVCFHPISHVTTLLNVQYHSKVDTPTHSRVSLFLLFSTL